jgi:hypothetical protein
MKQQERQVLDFIGRWSEKALGSEKGCFAS